MSKAEFDPAELARTIERLAREQDIADWSEARPGMDPQVRKDVRDDAIRGGRIERYVQALERAGLVLVPAQALGTWSDGSPHREPLWMHPDYDLQIAFSEDDILTLFRGDDGPKELYEWVTDKQRRLAARRAGLLLPPAA